jgi:hypothetical protein
MKTQVTSAIARLKHGADKNSTQLDLTGIIISFKSNFKPSANACNTPQNPVTLGPLRLCIEASSLRSAIVKNAMVSNEAIIVIKMINILFMGRPRFELGALRYIL